MSKSILSSASALALVAAFAPSHTVSAQERQSTIDSLVEEIVVTATKKTDAENVQDVPIAITAFNDRTLEALKVRTLENLSFSTPNVSLDEIGTSRGTANFAIRGLGVNSSIPSIDPTVGVFVDGVYLGLNSGVVFDIFDLDSIEVLRGPQGILFGRNTTGGAILINTGNPTDEFEAKVRAAYEGPVDSGRGGGNKFIQGTVSGPLVEGKLNGKVGFYYNGDSGYFRNLATGENHGEADTFIGRGALEFLPSDTVRFLAKFEYFDSDGDGPAAQNRGLFERDSFDLSIDNTGSYSSEVFNFSLRTDIDVEFGNGQITNIFGYRDSDGTTSGDIDSTPLFIFHSDTELAQDQISNELRYNGTFDRINLTTGLYYFEQDVAYTETRDLPTVVPIGFSGGGSQEHTVFGAFASVDYALTDSVTFTAGLRYSKEDKDGGVTFVVPRVTPCSVVQGSCPTDPANGFTDDISFENFSPKLGITYDLNDNSLLYTSWSRGYRSGGFNFRITNPAAFAAQVAQTGQPTFDEEKVDNYEIGGKFTSPDGRGTLNLAAFYTDISNFQREVNVASAGAGVSQFILNTAEASILGFEAEGRYKISDNLLLTANVGLIDAEYDDVIFDISGDGVVTEADLALDVPRVPEATYGFGIIHEMDLGGAGRLVSRSNFQHRDRFAYTDNNFGFVQAADILDANITWETPYEGVAVSIYGRNLLDEVQVGGDTQLPFGGALSAAVPGSQNLANGVNAPFDVNPAAGTFSPLKKGRILGVELTIRY